MKKQSNTLLLCTLTAALLVGLASVASADATKLVDHGSDAERFDLVILAEGYTEDQLAAFAENADAFAEYFLATAPFRYNCSAFNIWRVDTVSAESGADDPSDCTDGTGAEVDTFFGATFCADGANRRLLSVNEQTVLQTLDAEVPGWDQALVIVNSEIYGGSGGGVAVSSLNGRWQRIAIHEIGHAAFGLADEYEYFAGCGLDLDRDVHPAVEPVAANVTTASSRDSVKWSEWIDAETPVPTTENADCEQCDSQDDPYPGQPLVGLYEGAHYYHCDSYRPTFNGMMRNYGIFCPVCTERILDSLQPFQPVNTAPVCDANGPYLAECDGATTEVSLDGMGSSDADCDMLEYLWAGEFDEETTTGQMPPVHFSGLGDFGVELEVSDGEAASLCESTVTVEDTIPPVIVIADVTAECGSPDGTMVDLGDPVIDEVCDSEPLVTNDAPDLFPLGTSEVNWSAVDASDNLGQAVQVVTVEDSTPPELTVPEDITEECGSHDGNDVDLGTPIVSDLCDVDVEVTNDAPEMFPLGVTEVTWVATDASGNQTSGVQTVTIVDTTPPEFSMYVTPDSLWPPNHKWKSITAHIEVYDVCDPEPQVILASVESNEPVNANGSGNTEPDIQGAEIGTDDREFELRAERAGPGDDRIYSVSYVATDGSGNQSFAEDQVIVPHDQGNNP